MFALAYWAGRSLITARVGRSAGFFTPYHLSAVVTGPLLVLGAFLPAQPWREIVWGVVALAEVAGLWVLRERMTVLRYDAEHVVERFGALILIALGESLVAIGEALVQTEHVGWAQGGVMAASFVLVTALWWAYFHHGDRFVRSHLEQASDGAEVVRSVLAYGHLVLVGGVILVSVGLHTALEEPGEALSAGPAVLLGTGTALFLGEFVYIRWHAFRALYRSKAVGVLGALVVGACGTLLPALLTVVLLALVVVLIDLWEVLSPGTAGLPLELDGA